MKRGLAIVVIVAAVAIGYVVLVMEPRRSDQAGGDQGPVLAPEPTQGADTAPAADVADEARGQAGEALEAAGETAGALADRAADAVGEAAQEAGRLLEQGAGAASEAADTAREAAGNLAQDATEGARAAVDEAGDTARALLDQVSPPATGLPDGPVTPELIAGLENPGGADIGALKARVGALVDRADIGLTEKAVIRGLLARAETDPSALTRAIERLSVATAN